MASRPWPRQQRQPVAHRGAHRDHRPEQHTAVRHFAGKHDRAATSFKTRPPTRKQRKKYHRRQRALNYEKTKHSPPNSKASARRQEERERQARLIEIALEEEALKKRLGQHLEKVRELQAKIEASPKFRALLEAGDVSPEAVREAARDAAKRAAEKSDHPHPPLPSWWQDRLSYDWGDALVDDLIGNSADLTSSPSPYPVHMGEEYGRLRRKVERAARTRREEERFRLEENRRLAGREASREKWASVPLMQQMEELAAPAPALPDAKMQQQTPTPKSGLSDRLLSDLIRSHRDATGKRTAPTGLVASLKLLHELQIPLSALGTWCYVSLLTCCKSPYEGRKLDDMRRASGVRSNEYFWSSLVDVYARAGDYRGAESVLDEMMEVSKAEHGDHEHFGKKDTPGQQAPRPIAIPPLPAYTSFFAACHKIIARSDVHPSVKADAGKRAWLRWKEMRIHSVPPDAMAYGALMRIFASQGRAEKAVDLLDEVMLQMMRPVSASDVLNKDGSQLLKSPEGEMDGWYDDRDGNTVEAKPTTLLFTSALKAVAKSHEIATRFSGGMSKKNRRRESIAAHHGRMTRKIVTLAEQAEVVQDDGFCSALMLCAAAAGDSSTARAVYLASKVRRLDHLRTCGGKEHLKRLQGLVPETEKRALLDGPGDKAPAQSGDGLMNGSSGSSKPALRSIEEEYLESHAAYEHREYGIDTRPFSTLLLSHAKAMEPKGLGSMWAGKYNRGYLCHNSLRYIEAYQIPQKENMAIKGLSSVEAGLSPEGWENEDFGEDEGKTSKQLRKKHKFRMKQIMGKYGEGIHRKDDMDSSFDAYDVDPQAAMDKQQTMSLNVEEQHTMSLNGGVSSSEGGEMTEVEGSRDWLDDRLLGKEEIASGFEDYGTSAMDNSAPNAVSAMGNDSAETTSPQWGFESGSDHNFANDFDDDSDSCESEDESDNNEGVSDGFDTATSAESGREALVQAMAEAVNDPELAESLIPTDLDLSGNDQVEGGDSFDEEAFRKLMAETAKGMDETQSSKKSEDLSHIPGVSTDDFGAFQSHLKDELVAEGKSPEDVDESEARQLFDMMRSFYDESKGTKKVVQGDVLDDESIAAEAAMLVERAEMDGSMEKPSFASALNIGKITTERSFFDSASVPNQLREKSTQRTQQKSPTNGDTMASSKTIYADDYIEWASSQTTTSNALASSGNEVREGTAEPSATEVDGVALQRHHLSPSETQGKEPHITELQQHLPGLPLNRIEKVSDEFSRTLGYPSILRLALAVRENMPEAFSPQCLVRKNLANAKHVMSEAEKEGVVDVHLLNGMLRVHTNSGRIEPAIRFYDTEFRKHGMTPTTHSDRLLLEMLIKKKRLSRAFTLKQNIEKEGRSLDLLSYGSLVEHFSNQKQLGSALLLIKECMEVHGVPPGEKSLKNVRLMCRQNSLTKLVGLERLIGEDPLEWLRHGEQLKRVQDKRAKSSDMHFVLNRMVDI